MVIFMFVLFVLAVVGAIYLVMDIAAAVYWHLHGDDEDTGQPIYSGDLSKIAGAKWVVTLDNGTYRKLVYQAKDGAYCSADILEVGNRGKGKKV